MNDAPKHSPLSALRGLAADEEASAAVEFIVLIPVYLLMMAALWMFTNLSLIRVGLVQAGRFQVWSAVEPDTYANFNNGSAFFPNQEGGWLDAAGNPSATPQVRTKTPVTMWGGDVNASDLSTGPQNAHYIAAWVLNNGGSGEQPLMQVEGRLTYEYRGLTIFGLGAIPQSVTSGVLLTHDVTRAEYDASGGAANARSGGPTAKAAHPVLFWGSDASDTEGKTTYFDPSQDANMPLSPLYDNDGEFTQQGGSANAGIWDKKARIKGDQGGEHEYYEDKPKAP